MPSLLLVILHSKLDFQILNYVCNQNYFILCIIKFIHIYLHNLKGYQSSRTGYGITKKTKTLVIIY
jgi:hypothetical protein